ncbi:aldo/keto reductase (plasmid) [Streptomyces sp. NBC_01260]|uniref:aldo/keto reductase n=1 Tax=unclassified Streptomyces TaxID=2593676 RepID=UPI000F467F62|nr:MULTISPECIES: aldo/keto reductase [unclassified Streptomyces]MCX4775186.1 aldo/keto reductase [Streptomyces sp. NBC_01285]
MKHRTLGKPGLVVPAQGLGCMGMTFGYGEADEKEARATIDRALELGVTLLDTADMYGPYTNEELIGRAVAGRRDKVVIASKVGNEVADGQLTWRLNGRPDYIRRSIEGTLRRLGTDYLDLYYLHRVDPDVPVEESFGALAELVQAGLVRHLGISEAGPATIRRAHAVHPLTAVQTEYSLFTRDVEVNGVLDTVRELGIGFVAYSPLGRGFLTGTIRGTSDIPEGLDFRRIAPRFKDENIRRNLPVVDRLSELAAAADTTVTRLALAWVLSRGDDVVAIPGTKRRTYLEENVSAADVELSADVLAAIDAIAPYGVTAGNRYPDAEMPALSR